MPLFIEIALGIFLGLLGSFITINILFKFSGSFDFCYKKED
uniref:Uncharacterized protein n=1 Tax=viral metagenome TaxID=1070528 RepID=A0A6M3J1N7_9ZZZZ